MVVLNKEEREKILQRIEKLMSHTDTSNGRTFNENEITLANKKIKELTDEYGITLEEIKTSENGGDRLVEMVSVDIFNGKMRVWAGSLAGIIARFYDCKVVITNEKYMNFIGFSLDAEVSAEMYKKLYFLIARTSKVNDFGFGAVVALNQRLEEIKREREKLNQVTALVLVKSDAVDEKVKKLFPHLRNSKKIKFERSESFYRGYQFGKNVEIFKGVEGGKEVKKTEFKKKVFKIKRTS